MIRKLIKSDIRNNPLFSFMTVLFMTVSSSGRGDLRGTPAGRYRM
ncbi:hypothetical protein [Faecalicatena contorta]|nr:hypothetical protein [Faecalicatena contorta]